MKEISIGNSRLRIKDYYCAEAGDHFLPLAGEGYYSNPDPRLWLYVNVTDCCDAACPFCVSGSGKHGKHSVDPDRFSEVLRTVSPNIYGISFTGGEPMLYPDLLEELILCAAEILPDDVEIDLATNGTNLPRLTEMRCMKRISSVHISRHSYDQIRCESLMHFSCPDADELKRFIGGLDDSGKVVLNCVMQTGGVESCEDIAAYLDFAIGIGVKNTSFITMFESNQFCRDHYVSPMSLPLVSDRECAEWNGNHPDARFEVWNRHSDHEFCHCLSGSYENPEGRTRFYLRCPGTVPGPDYCRQFVYTADNNLQDGFGKNRTVLLDKWD